MVKVYAYAKCSTCRDAAKWLRDHGVEFEERPIKETPPTREELARMVAAHGGNLRKVFNTSGLEYRKLGLADRLDTLAPAEAFPLLQKNGMLVKRPFVLGDGVALVGFDPTGWAAAFGK